MNRHLALVIGGLIATAGCANKAQVQAGELAPVTPLNSSRLPAGTVINTRLNQTVGTSSSREGESFSATVVDPVIAENGSTVIPEGAILSGRITGLHSAREPGDQSVIRLNFDRLAMRGRDYPFDGAISSVNVQNRVTGESAHSIVRPAVTGAAAGAVLGAIISGGELSKIITGGLIGAAAGTVISLGTGVGSEAVIPAGSLMQVQATQSVRLR
jgi:hypothetical protein